MKRVLFLFNHDAAHQVAHLAGVAGAMIRTHPDVRTVIAFATPALRAQVERHLLPAEVSAAEWHELLLPPVRRWLLDKLDRLLPASRLARLHNNVALFAGVDMVVSTERTCLRLKRHFAQGEGPAFAKIPHGAGDRSVAWHPDYRRFDLSLVAGRKVVDQLVGAGVERERLRIVGYPKFDTVAEAAPARLFDNDRPTFVYNPHFDPHLSSWYDAGPDLLRWFATKGADRFNLVFAPHVMLFRKRWHVSPEYRVARRRPDVPPEALAAPNVHVDVAGPALFDMTYTRGGDAYIGDVSSQIYEFLQRPRPAFFLDCRRRERDGDVGDLESWQAGPVSKNVQDLTALLHDWQAIGERYRAAQEVIFAHTIDIGERPAVERAADAIADWVSA
ncbi:hypothetical protein [Aurantiacibacter luteus]|uniref:Glycosyl transferase n=1 Tax=Aurantiacibacter luteus TaxID=1581420 RepID=A0A0G9MXX2_9SPHN|nr:hypothetical protein [Aurantiacibacter luteus]KLE35424.1 hypothetical protein AAW00_03035 [Aurantiacibacter luteus]